MSQYLLSVFHSPGAQAELTVYQSEEEMQRRFQTVGAFNDRLLAEHRLVAAGGLTPPEEAVVIDGTVDDPTSVGGPRPQADLYLGGFWIIEADSDEQARQLTVEASRACGIPLELRRLAG